MDRNRGRGNRNFNSTSDSENSKETTPKVTEDSQGEKKRQEEVSVGTTSDTQGKNFFEDIEPMVDSTLPVGKPVQQNSGNVIAFFQEREPAAGVPPKSIEESHSDLQSSKPASLALCSINGITTSAKSFRNSRDSVTNVTVFPA
ncbi:hypothetical protein ACOSQ4_031092 [Xanthoceras sorbifolium]